MDINYSLKSILVACRLTYKQKLYQKLYKFIQNLRWKAYWYSKYNDTLLDDNLDKTHYGFPTKNSAPECEKLKYFEHDLYMLVKSIEFRKSQSQFQKNLSADIKKIKSSNNLIISSDKTDNLYSISKSSYNKLIKECLTNNYKIASKYYLEQINSDTASIVKELNI